MHLIEEPFPAGGFAILLEGDFGKGLLVQGCASRSVLHFS